MRLTYTGPHAAIRIAATGQLVDRGDTADVPDDVADALAATGDWSTPKPAKSRSTDPAPAEQ